MHPATLPTQDLTSMEGLGIAAFSIFVFMVIAFALFWLLRPKRSADDPRPSRAELRAERKAQKNAKKASVDASKLQPGEPVGAGGVALELGASLEITSGDDSKADTSPETESAPPTPHPRLQQRGPGKLMRRLRVESSPEDRAATRDSRTKSAAAEKKRKDDGTLELVDPGSAAERAGT